MSTRTPVILVHGLWMRSAALGRLAARLDAAGFAPQRFGYASIAGGPEAAAPALAARIRALGPGPVHLLAHSLGGLIALETLRLHPALPVGRVVCLGSPLTGSAAARGMARWPGGARLLGRSAALLDRGFARCVEGVAVGVIAGNLPLGLGVVFGRFAGPHDGTVAVAETRLPGIADHRVIAASHTGLLFSSAAARLAVAFLRDGRFG